MMQVSTQEFRRERTRAQRFFNRMSPLYPIVERHLFPQYRDVLSRIDLCSDLSVLDLATGTGLLAGAFAVRGHVVTGLDFADRLLNRARQRTGRRNSKRQACASIGRSMSRTTAATGSARLHSSRGPDQRAGRPLRSAHRRSPRVGGPGEGRRLHGLPAMGPTAAWHALGWLPPGAQTGLQAPAQAYCGSGAEGLGGLSSIAGKRLGGVDRARRPVPDQHLVFLPSCPALSGACPTISRERPPASEALLRPEAL